MSDATAILSNVQQGHFEPRIGQPYLTSAPDSDRDLLCDGSLYLRSAYPSIEGSYPEVGINPMNLTFTQGNVPPSTSYNNAYAGQAGVILLVSIATPAYAIQRTTDYGVTWTSIPSSSIFGTGDYLVGIATDGAGNWLAISGENNTKITKSTDDGATWTLVTGMGSIGSTYTNYMRGIDYVNGHWVVTHRAYIAPSVRVVTKFSTDLGATWSSAVIVATGSGTSTSYQMIPRTLVWDGTKYVMMIRWNNNGTNTWQLAYSSDMTSWTAASGGGILSTSFNFENVCRFKDPRDEVWKYMILSVNSNDPTIVPLSSATPSHNDGAVQSNFPSPYNTPNSTTFSASVARRGNQLFQSYGNRLLVISSHYSGELGSYGDNDSVCTDVVISGDKLVIIKGNISDKPNIFDFATQADPFFQLPLLTQSNNGNFPGLGFSIGSSSRLDWYLRAK